jgi:hypothetical protein
METTSKLLSLSAHPVQILALFWEWGPGLLYGDEEDGDIEGEHRFL